MRKEDVEVFRDAYRLYDKWIETEIQGEEMWMQVCKEFVQLTVKHKDNCLALHLAVSMFEVFDDLYSQGKKPEIPDYIGRSDL